MGLLPQVPDSAAQRDEEEGEEGVTHSEAKQKWPCLRREKSRILDERGNKVPQEGGGEERPSKLVQAMRETFPSCSARELRTGWIQQDPLLGAKEQ